MSDDDANSEPAETRSPLVISGIFDGVVSSVAAFLSSLPATIRKNTAKAAGILIGEAARIPRAMIRAKEADIESAAKARTAVTDALVQAAIGWLPEHLDLADRALNHFASTVLKGQRNREQIIAIAMENLCDNPPRDDADDEIDDDWVTMFSSIAERISNEEMRIYLGKILAGEIRKPGSFSPATIHRLTSLTREDAQLFQRLCNMSYAIGDYAGVLTEPFGNPVQNSLKPFGLAFDQLNALNEDGLIIADYNSHRQLAFLAGTKLAFGYARMVEGERVYDFSGSIESNLVFDYAGSTVALVPIRGGAITRIKPLAQAHGVAFTRVGRELRRIISKEMHPEYTKQLNDWLHDELWFTLVHVPPERVQGA